MQSQRALSLAIETSTGRTFTAVQDSARLRSAMELCLLQMLALPALHLLGASSSTALASRNHRNNINFNKSVTHKRGPRPARHQPKRLSHELGTLGMLSWASISTVPEIMYEFGF